MRIFDFCIITASNDEQAEIFRALIKRRQEAGLYPREIGFFVCADPGGFRVGSGGGTLSALRRLLDEAAPGKDMDAFLAERSVLIIHAGGESRRLPTFMPEGKLFAPVPAASSALVSPCVLDLELSLYFRYPWVRGEVVVASGDVIIDFDTENFDMPLGDAITGIGAPESFIEGSRHGVFVFDPLSGAVVDYLQKASPELLAKKARIEGSDTCALDLGIVSFRGKALSALIGLSESKVAGEKIGNLIERGAFSFDLYLEILTACLSSLSHEEYCARMVGRSSLSSEGLDAIYACFSPLGLAGALAKRHSFVHFGSVSEFPKACLEQRVAGLLPFYALPREEYAPQVDELLIKFNSVNGSVEVAKGAVYASCVENCRDISLVCSGGNLLSGLRNFKGTVLLPEGFCLDERTLLDGTKLRMVYHALDSFKPVGCCEDLVFCARSLDRWLSERGLSFGDLGLSRGVSADLYKLGLFIPGDDDAFLEGYWKVPSDPDSWKAHFLAAPRLSIAEVNRFSDASVRDAERSEARRMEFAGILQFMPFSSFSGSDLSLLADSGVDLSSLERRYIATDDPLLKAYRGEVLGAAGSPIVGLSERVPVRFWLKALTGALRATVKQDQIVWARSPVRLDLAGGWTDTPPYTNRYGGSVVNVAVDLNGQSPIQVFVRRMAEPFVRIHSIDLGITEDIRTAGSLRAYNDPRSGFALPRAALVLLGLDDGLSDDTSLEKVLGEAGGGLEITLLCAVPKGSGLGTSSILAGTILGALERFFGLKGTRDELFLKVLETEQMLTTGGGWQDQIGGLVGGVKYIESKPALKPRPIVHQLDPWLFEDPSSVATMTLFYTGVTRLAKNILSEVVSRVNSMDRSFLFTHDRLKSLAHDCRDVFSLRDREGLGRIISSSFTENKLVHASTTNADIDRMVAETAPYCEGVKLLGAGGGGFAFILSPDATSADALRSILASRFEDERARLVDFSLNKRGLEVTVS